MYVMTETNITHVWIREINWNEESDQRVENQINTE